MIKLYNTMTRRLEPFTPIKDGTVNLYTCGPTVYNSPHIGNWLAFIRWDILNRMLTASGYQTNWVMNITDVGHLTSDGDEGEDKLEAKAKLEGKNAWQIAETYIEEFKKGLIELNFSGPTQTPKATDHIQGQIDIIQHLQNKGLTYNIDDGVYFDTSKLDDYGKLSKLKLDSIKPGARVEYNAQKKNPTDFALWKFSPEDSKRDMEWDSPWGKGFPGWHLECSAIVKDLLGETIDIHGGGIDHIAIHHTNEIAQSESYTDKPLANYWMHVNHLVLKEGKMAKSKGNFVTLQEIIEKGISLEAFRIFVLESHYRSEPVFDWEILISAQNRLKTFEAMADLRFQPIDTETQESESYNTEDILESLQDDLNTPLALSRIDKIASSINNQLIPRSSLKEFEAMLESIDKLLGTKLSNRDDIDTSIKELMNQRAHARQANDWTKADQLRQQLADKNIEVRDTPTGQIWSRL